MTRRIVVTGATGTLGRSLVTALLATDARVVVLSRTPHRLNGMEGWPLEVYSYDATGMRRAMDAGPVDALVHAACSYGRNQEGVAEIAEANLLGPLRIAQAVGARIGAWINVGTSLPASASAYALSKRQFADWLGRMSGHEMCPVTNIELEHFYGPGDSDKNFVTRIARACLRGEVLDLTAGEQLRDFIHVDDAVAGIITLLDNPSRGFRTVPLGSGEVVSIRELVTLVHGLASSTSQLRFGNVPMRSGEPQVSRADIQALRQLGWMPGKNLKEGIKGLIEHERLHSIR